MLDVPPGYTPRARLLANLLGRLREGELYQALVNTQAGASTITIGLSMVGAGMLRRLAWMRGDALHAHQLAAADMNLLDLFLVDEESRPERELLHNTPGLIARMPHHGMQSLVFGAPRVGGYVVYLSENHYQQGAENTCTMWGLLHGDDLHPHNMGDPLMQPFYHYMEYFHEELLDLLTSGRYLRLGPGGNPPTPR